MNNDTKPSPWDTAQSECWSQVSTATELAKVAASLSHIPVAMVMPILSSIAPTLLISPLRPDDIKDVRRTLDAIASTFIPPPQWKTFAVGENWTARLIVSHNVRIDVTTTIPASEPTKFEV